MTRAAIHPSYLLIERRLGVIARRHRAQLAARGAMLWLTLAAAATVTAGLTAHATGAGTGATLTLAAWATVLAAGAIAWVVRPLLRRSDPLDVARLVEGRVGGLHDGLTNSLMLAGRADVADSPWLGPIFDEVWRSAAAKPLGDVAALRDLGPLAGRLAVALAAVLSVAVACHGRVAHGWRQLASPAAFVPRTGAARIVEVRPGDVSLVAGDPLAVECVATVEGRAGAPPVARLIFDTPPAGTPGVIELPPSVVEDKANRDRRVRYEYRVSHLDQTTRYRVEVAGTQSPWFNATAVRQVKLVDLALTITPPAYTSLATRKIVVDFADPSKTPVTVVQGSRVEVAATTDVPVGGARLQVGDFAPPLAMAPAPGRRRFTGATTVVRESPIVILLTDAAGQALFRVPAAPLVIGCTPDAPPSIEMQWPSRDVAVPLGQAITVSAVLRDDYGLTRARVRLGVDERPAGPTTAPAAGDELGMAVVHEQRFAGRAGAGEPVRLTVPLNVDPALRRHGVVLRLQLDATDNRDLGPADPALGPQTASSAVFRIRFADPARAAREDRQAADALRERLARMLRQQTTLHDATAAADPGATSFAGAMRTVGAGQVALRADLKATADTFAFPPRDLVVQKALLMLALGPAKDAVELSALLVTEPSAPQRRAMAGELRTNQRRVIATLESLVASLGRDDDPPTTRPTRDGGPGVADLPAGLTKLDEDLKAFANTQRRLLGQTAELAKKPVERFDGTDLKSLSDLQMAQDRLDAFMRATVREASKLAEQDATSVSLVREAMEVQSEVTMAQDALKQKAVTAAVSAQEIGVELAETLSGNIEKWLADSPDRTKWVLEDPPAPIDVPMAPLPKDISDIVGKLLEQEEDLFNAIEDANANWAGSFDKGVGWDAADGPIANLSAKGVTGNALPNDNETAGRSGEGRRGRSSGEMVGDAATGKGGGRNTPTRLDPTPIQPGRVRDASPDPAGGATGGGKIGGQGAAGLTGNVPPATVQEQMQRLARQQAQLRNEAERLDLQYRAARYDQFKLTQAAAGMRRVEADLNANRYRTALHRRDGVLDALDASRTLLAARVHVERDTTPTASEKDRRDAGDAMRGELPPAWRTALEAYYETLGRE